jgi:hypothetical protein
MQMARNGDIPRKSSEPYLTVPYDSYGSIPHNQVLIVIMSLHLEYWNERFQSDVNPIHFRPKAI